MGKQRHIRRGLAALVAGLLLSTTGIAAPAQAATPTMVNPTANCGATHRPTDSLRVVGRRLEDSSRHVIVPEGISVLGGPEERSYLRDEAATYAQIEAAARAWHVNSQRLQVSEGNLLHRVTPGYGYNRTFANYLARMICRVLGHHEIPIINDNTMFTGNRTNPTQTTTRFWDYMSVNYRHAPIIFDLFNEPRLRHYANGAALGAPLVWRLWSQGGIVSRVRYVGMQSLVNEIRNRDHAGNVIWIESPYETAATSQLGGHLIHGRNLMYSFHKLNLNNPNTWYAVDALARRGLALVDGEWSEFASPERPWECYSSAYTSAPKYLNYWRSQGVGIEAWSLQYGVLVKPRRGQHIHDGNYSGGPTNFRTLEVPNTMSSSFGCNTTSLGQGAGSLVMRYFARSTRAAPRQLFAPKS